MTFRKIILTVLLAGALASPAVAQTRVSAADIQKLQDEVSQASDDVSRLRDGGKLQAELDDLRDEVTYLKVKLRKEGRVSTDEYQDLRSRLQSLRSRALGRPDDRRAPQTSGPPVESSSGIPAGQEIDVRLQTRLGSATAQVEDRFEATTVVDLYRGNDVIIPAGSIVRGVVRTVDPATRTQRRGQMTVSFDQITIGGRTYPMRGTVVEALKSEGMKGEAGRIGAGAGVGAIIGGILGGVKGALLGILVGGGGTIAATDGKDVVLEPGTVLRVRLDTPPDIGGVSR